MATGRRSGPEVASLGSRNPANPPLPSPTGEAAVYDLGSGTFDTAALQVEAGETKILGSPEGIEWMEEPIQATTVASAAVSSNH